MKSKFVGYIVLAILTFSFILTGCSPSNSGDKKEIEKKQGTENHKDELVMAIGDEPEAGFDPTTGWGRYGSPLFQSTLLKMDNELTIINDLATGYEVTEDGKTWIVNLRDDVKFSDGEPLTAEDVKFTFETTADNGSVVDLNIIEKVEVTDEHTVKFTLKKAQSTFVNTLVLTGIVPKHAYDEDYAENPVGSGPYELLQWDKGQQLIVTANPEYYDTKSHFEKLTFLFLNEDAAFAAAKAGNVDVAYIPAAFSNEEVSGMRLEAVNTVDNRGIAFPYGKSGDSTSDGVPIGNDVTADPAIRHAINIAIDREALVDGVLEGHGTPAYTSVDGLPWWNPDTVIEDANLDSARKLLKDAGWEDTNGDGILEKGELKAEFTLYYVSDDAIRQSLSITVADMMKSLGINIEVEGASWDTIEKHMFSNAVLMGKGSHNPHEMYVIYGRENAGIGFNNTSYYQNETVEDYFKKALHATNETEANEFWKKAQWDGTTGLSARGDAPWAWLVNIDHLYLVRDGIDIGKQRTHVHGHGWPVTDNIMEWSMNK